MTDCTRSPISKRLRYEILRRDNFACRYCGRSAPDVALAVDHVLPVALGGDNSAGNLATACTDCNAGKSSTVPDAPLVDQVNEDAARWARARHEVNMERAAEREFKLKSQNEFRDMWNAWTYGGGKHFELAPDWRNTIDKHMSAGLTLDDFDELIDVAMARKFVDPWRYFNGCCWRRLEDIQDRVADRLRGER